MHVSYKAQTFMKNDVASSFNHLHQDLNQQSFSNIFSDI